MPEIEAGPHREVDCLLGARVMPRSRLVGYTSLNDRIVIAVLAVFLLASAVYAAASRHAVRGPGDFRIFLLANFALVLAATLVLRRGFTTIYGEYGNSFPDRYFTGLNIMFMTAFMATALSVPSPMLRRLAGAGVVAMIASWLAVLPIFERAVPSAGQRDGGTLRDAFCERARGEGILLPPSRPGVETLASYPIVEGHIWRLDVPRPIFDRTVSLQFPAGPNGG